MLILSVPGYFPTFCKILLESLDELPGDSRTKVGFMTFDGSIHFYNLGEGLNQPHMLVVSDIEGYYLYFFNHWINILSHFWLKSVVSVPCFIDDLYLLNLPIKI